MIRIIDFKKVDMTDDEYNMYLSICESYNRPNFEGKELFKDHFEVNKDGIIVFVKPSKEKFCSLEVYMFLCSLMQNQHIRIMHSQLESLIKEASNKINELTEVKLKDFTKQNDVLAKKINEVFKYVEKNKNKSSYKFMERSLKRE